VTDDVKTCEWTEERLPLLRYAGELEQDERVAVLAHLDGCEDCKAAQRALDASSAALASVPLEHPEGKALEGLKARVLASVNIATCPHEVELLDPDAEGPALHAHVSQCATCREALVAFGHVEQALDRVPFVAADLSMIKPTVLERTGVTVQATKAGRVVRFPVWRVVAAAAAIAAVAGAFALGRATAVDPAQVIALKQSADHGARSTRLQDRASVAAAIQAYELVADVEDRRVADVVAQARREVEALRALDGLGADGEIGLLDLEQVMIDHPDAGTTFECALKVYESQALLRERVTPGIVPSTGVLPWRGGPLTTRISYVDVVTEFEAALKWVTDWRLRQAIQLNRGMTLEEMGDVFAARAAYREVLSTSVVGKADTPAMRVARERLAKLG
jgi:hypothetical protein